MMETKVIIALIIVCLGTCIASILKLAARKQLTVFGVFFSMLMPILMLRFMVHFFRHVYKKNIKELAFPGKFFDTIKFVFIEIQIIPLIHTAMVDGIASLQEELSLSKISFPLDKKNKFLKVLIEDFHQKKFLPNSPA